MNLIFATAAVAALTWQYREYSDPLGKQVYVAETVATNEMPLAKIAFSCGGVIGVELLFNLGQTAFSSGALSIEEPAWEDVEFNFPEGAYPTTAKRSPLTEGIGTFEIKGEDAMFIARMLKAGGDVLINHNSLSTKFVLDGAGDAINQVIDACPYKYRDQ